MEVEELYAEGGEEKMEVEDNTVSHNLNNSIVFSVQDICDTIATLLSSVSF